MLHFYWLMKISTHTPLARCGASAFGTIVTTYDFNSHTPREVWRSLMKVKILRCQFQLTHPSRGVAVALEMPNTSSVISTHTPLARCGCNQHSTLPRRYISTHTPLARCGLNILSAGLLWYNFNSHTPREVWHIACAVILICSVISTHTPLARCGVRKRTRSTTSR